MPYYTRTEQPPRITRSYRAALYIRLSREDGDKTESDSVVNQKRLLTNFVNNQPDIELHDCYIDDGYSGASFNRPDFLRMMADVYAQKINCVIVKDSSRFGRNASESGRYLGEIFPRLQVRYIAVNDAIDSGKSQSIAIDFLNNTMRGMINEYYVAANSESIRSTLDMERRRGLFVGAFAKYGYKKDPADRHKLLIDEEAAEVVRLIYRMYLNGTGMRTIVRTLNERGIPNPSNYKCQAGLNFQARTIGKSILWCDKTVRRILQDEMYTGDMIQGMFRKASYKDKAIIALPQEEWIRVNDTHEAIISKEDFERVQRMLGSHAKSSQVTGEIGLFAGLIRCADCGHALIKKSSRNANNPEKRYTYYRCSSYNKCRGACTAHTIRHEKVYDTVLACIQKMVEIAVDADEVISEMKRNRTESYSIDLRARLSQQEQELEKVKHRMADLYPDYKDGILNADQYKLNKQQYERQQQQLQANIESIKASIDHIDSPNQTNAFIEHFKQHGNIDTLTRPLLIELIDHITVSADGEMEITFNFADAFQTAKELVGEKLNAFQASKDLVEENLPA